LIALRVSGVPNRRAIINMPAALRRLRVARQSSDVVSERLAAMPRQRTRCDMNSVA
jgi:hypothetical protein